MSIKKNRLSASVMCFDFYKFEETVNLLEEEKIDFLHIDVMDGTFVKNYALGTDLIKELRLRTKLRFDYHFMTVKPFEKIKWFPINEGDIVSFHIESVSNDKVFEIINYLKKIKAKVFIALNPDTPLNTLFEYLSYLDGVLIMTVYPGFAGQKIVSSTFDKINELFKMKEEKCFDIQVDGNMSIENITLAMNNGANLFVLGSSSVFNKNIDIKKEIDLIKKIIKWRLL